MRRRHFYVRVFSNLADSLWTLRWLAGPDRHQSFVRTISAARSASLPRTPCLLRRLLRLLLQPERLLHVIPQLDLRPMLVHDEGLLHVLIHG